MEATPVAHDVAEKFRRWRMGKLKRGQRMSCVPCGREVVIDVCGASEATIWCCGQPMRPKTKKIAKKKVSKKKK
jgi:hypothetical protein